MVLVGWRRGERVIPLTVVGLMSGTSLDAVDVARCEFAPDTRAEDGLTLRLLDFSERPLPTELRAQVLDLLRESAASLDTLTELNVALGEAFADAALVGLRADGHRPDLIASHGQTIYHQVALGRRYSTWQMGEPAVIAAHTGLTVTASFRAADMAAGGQGAPLVSLFDALIFRGERTRAVQNIGGMANVTFVPPEGEPYAFDTGPGNVLLDSGARYLTRGASSFDRDGAIARPGAADESLVAEVLKHPYFAQPPPKTTGRELFGDDFAADVIRRGEERGLSPNDIMATLTVITAESIARAYRAFGPDDVDEVVLSGGGARNPSLVEALRARLPDISLRHHDELGIPGDAKEAVAFALLGYLTIHGHPGNVPRCTGATRPVTLGQITPGDNYDDLMYRIFGGRAGPCRPIRTLRLLR